MTLYLAIVQTYYETYAIADTRAKARNLALTKAKQFLNKGGFVYKTLQQVEDAIGCNTYELPLNTAILEG